MGATSNTNNYITKTDKIWEYDEKMEKRDLVVNTITQRSAFSTHQILQEINQGAKDAQTIVPPTKSNSELAEVRSSSVDDDDESSLISRRQQQQQLPHLENLYVMMGPKERVYPNNNVAVDIDSELFSGKMLLMFRTPDVDDHDKQQSDNPIVSFFKGRQRRFEFQWQFKLKEVPQHGDLFFCAELNNPIEMGVIQRVLTSTALRFVKKMNPGFTYHLSDSHDRPSYLSFPVGTSMDKIVVTNPRGHSDLPQLGKVIVESKESMKQRMKGEKIDWNVDDIYTMSFGSMYVDFLDWKLMNFPGLKPFAITTVAGIQPIKLTLYTDGRNCDELMTSRKEEVQRNIVFNMEVSNAIKSTLGGDAKEWLAARDKPEQTHSSANIQQQYYSPGLVHLPTTKRGHKVWAVPENLVRCRQ